MAGSAINKFKNSQGVRYLAGLFYETSPDKASVVYTLKDWDHEGYPSLYRLYMLADDPTEYNFALAHLDGYDHWERLTKSTWFLEYVTRWRKELDLRLRAEALSSIRETARSADAKTSFAVNRFLLEGGWKEKAHGRGRPSKDDIKKATDDLLHTKAQIDGDYSRLLAN